MPQAELRLIIIQERVNQLLEQKTEVTLGKLQRVQLRNIQMDVIYVDGANTSGNEYGTEEYAFNTIQEGIDAVAEGGWFTSSEGTYTEEGQIVIDKNGLRLSEPTKQKPLSILIEIILQKLTVGLKLPPALHG